VQAGVRPEVPAAFLQHQRGWTASPDWAAAIRTKQAGAAAVLITTVLSSSLKMWYLWYPLPPWSLPQWTKNNPRFRPATPRDLVLFSTASQINSARTSRIIFLQGSERHAGRRVKSKFLEVIGSAVGAETLKGPQLLKWALVPEWIASVVEIALPEVGDLLKSVHWRNGKDFCFAYIAGKWCYCYFCFIQLWNSKNVS
jgi:hypothetical protein